MQIPCLLIDCRRSPATWPRHRSTGWMAIAPVLVSALLAPWAQAQTEGSPTAAALQTQAARWVASRQGLTPAQIQVQAPDPRLRVPACPGGYTFDAPFGSAQTIRARCADPAGQLFLRARWEGSGEPDGRASERPERAAEAAAGTGQTGTAAGAATGTRRAVVLSRTVPRGTLLSPAAGEAVMLPAREVDSLVVTDLQHLHQMEAVRDLPPGVPLRSSDIRPAVLVKQGQMVQLTVGQGSGFVISVRLEALQDGRLGDRISLRNPESGRTVSGIVSGPNQAQGA